jgi:hypothetical protein
MRAGFVIFAGVLSLCLPAWAQVPVDGVYEGTATIEGSATGRAASGRCEQTIHFKLNVVGRSFVWKLPTSQATVTIAPDGTFSTQNSSRFLNGKIDGSHLSAQTTGRGCGYIWLLDRH